MLHKYPSPRFPVLESPPLPPAVSSYLVFTRNVVNAADENGLAGLVRQARIAWAATVDGAFPAADAGVWLAGSQRSSSALVAAAAASAAEETLPAPEDEPALAFLCLHAYDVPRAKLLLAALLGAGG